MLPTMSFLSETLIFRNINQTCRIVICEMMTQQSQHPAWWIGCSTSVYQCLLSLDSVWSFQRGDWDSLKMSIHWTLIAGFLYAEIGKDRHFLQNSFEDCFPSSMREKPICNYLQAQSYFFLSPSYPQKCGTRWVQLWCSGVNIISLHIMKDVQCSVVHP